MQAASARCIAWRNLFWGLTDAMARNADAVGRRRGAAERGVRRWPTAFSATIAYPRVKEIIEQTIASGLIYLNSHAADFQNPELRPYLDKYLRGSDGYDAVERVKLMKLLWDAIGTEFGGRHELYERNYAGATTRTSRFSTC